MENVDAYYHVMAKGNRREKPSFSMMTRDFSQKVVRGVERAPGLYELGSNWPRERYEVLWVGRATKFDFPRANSRGRFSSENERNRIGSRI